MTDEEFKRRQAAAQEAINAMDQTERFQNPKREAFFEAVYEGASGDAAMVPWADLSAKPHLQTWLKDHRPHTGKAIDIGCGLGDNAEALAAAGYETTAFDFSEKAIVWARKRFQNSSVDYQTGDLFHLPDVWRGTFDLVHECYTLQSIPPETLEKTVPAVASLVAPGGYLLVYTRLRPDGFEADGPPWPLEESVVQSFRMHGLSLVSDERFVLQKNDRSINHSFSQWKRES